MGRIPDLPRIHKICQKDYVSALYLVDFLNQQIWEAVLELAPLDICSSHQRNAVELPGDLQLETSTAQGLGSLCASLQWMEVRRDRTAWCCALSATPLQVR